MKTNKLHAGVNFQLLPVHDMNGTSVDISKPTGDADWQMVTVYRGRHCPMCTKFLNSLAGFRSPTCRTIHSPGRTWKFLCRDSSGYVSPRTTTLFVERLRRRQREMPVLEGIRIVEIEGLGPAPFAAMMLADLGAEVTVVHREKPRASGSERNLDRG